MNLGDAIAWSIQNDAVMRFVTKDNRREIFQNGLAGHAAALEMAATVNGRTLAAHCPLSISMEPSKAIALAVMSCAEHFVNKKSSLILMPGGAQ